MAATTLSDMGFIPQTFHDYVWTKVRESSAFFNSGAIVNVPELSPVYGSTVTLPAWKPMNGIAEVKGYSAPTTNAIVGYQEVAPILERVKKYGMSDIAVSFSGSDPLGALAGQVAEFWARDIDAAAISALVGAAGGVDALSAGTVIKDISGGVGAAAVISASAIVDAQALAGEYLTEFDLLVVHPDTFAVLRKANLISTMQDFETMKIKNYYGDAQVVLSSRLAGQAGVYNTLIVRGGAMGFADFSNPEHVFEEAREIGYETQFATSKRYALGVRGAQFLPAGGGAALTGPTANNTELGTIAKWTLGLPSVNDLGVRVLKHKNA